MDYSTTNFYLTMIFDDNLDNLNNIAHRFKNPLLNDVKLDKRSLSVMKGPSYYNSKESSTLNNSII